MGCGLSSPPPVARTRAQARATRAEQGPVPVASRPATITTHVASSGPRGISPRGPPVAKGGPAHDASRVVESGNLVQVA